MTATDPVPTPLCFSAAALELMGPSYRTFAGMVICVFFACALALLAGIAYLCRHWFVLSLSLSVPAVLLVS